MHCTRALHSQSIWHSHTLIHPDLLATGHSTFDQIATLLACLTQMSSLAQSFNSLERSSRLLSTLPYSNSAVLPRTVLSSVAQFETFSLREVEPHENGLFQPNEPNLETWGQPFEQGEDGGLVPVNDQDKWTATKRRAPKRADPMKDKPSPLKELNQLRNNKPSAASSATATAQVKENPGRCLKAAQRLLEVYPLPKESDHVEALHSQWLGVVGSISKLEEALSQPLARTGRDVQHDESYYRLLSLEDEIKREHLELLALEQFKLDREAELATLKPAQPAHRRTGGGTASRKVPSVVARSQQQSTKPQAVTPRTVVDSGSTGMVNHETLSTSDPARSKAGDDVGKDPSDSGRNAIMRPSVPSAVAIPLSIASKRKSIVAAVTTNRGTPHEREPSDAASSSSTDKEIAKPRLAKKAELPQGVEKEELELIGKLIWRLMGEGLKPWGKKWVREQGIEGRDVDEDGLSIGETIQTLESVLSTKLAQEPGSPSSASVSSCTTASLGGANDQSDPSPPPPSTLVEFKLLHLLLTYFTSVAPPPPSTSLPSIQIVLRGHPADSTTATTCLPEGSKTPCLPMNALKAHLGAFALERGWTEGMGTTSIYALISKQVARIDRRGKEGACVGFKL